MKSCLPLLLIALGVSSLLAAQTPPVQSVDKLERLVESGFGRLPSGENIRKFTLRNNKGMRVSVITYGAIITSLNVPDRKGATTNVIQGSDVLETYLGRFPAAAVQGRFANRIAKGRFSLDHVDYQLTLNAGAHHLHGGTTGFAKVVWNARPLPVTAHASGVRLDYLSANGAEGYPGNLTASVTYTLTDENELRVDYGASTDMPTIVNLTNHAYFDLSGTGHAAEQLLWLNADTYTLADNQLIPTGEYGAVKGTPLDFTRPATIGAQAALFSDPRQKSFDHNFVINGYGNGLVQAAELSDPVSGRVMRIFTNQPGIQLFTGNPIGVCLETQHFPDSPNHPEFPSAVVRPGQPFASTTVYQFLVR